MATKIISWNVNGLRAIIKKSPSPLIQLLESEAPDIVCLQEIKAAESDVPAEFTAQLDRLGYKTRIYNSATKRGYSGTALYAKEECRRLPEYEADAAAATGGEGRMIVAEFAKTIVINMYVPNSKPDLSRLDERVNVWEAAVRETIIKLEKVMPARKAIVIVGDLNVAPEEIDLTNYKTNKGKHGFTDQERAAFRDLIACGKGFIDSFRELHPAAKEYTWFSPFAKSRERNIGWRIDLMLISKRYKKKIVKAEILSSYTGSDHVPTLLELQ